MTNYNYKSTHSYNNVLQKKSNINLTANANIDRNVTDRFITRSYRLLLSADLLLKSVSRADTGEQKQKAEAP